MAKTANVLERYECGPFRFADDDYYDRHLVFDHVVALEKANTRQRFEAMASAIRDLLTQRWLLTGQTHDRQNPKQVYYLSMEFLIGRTLANNIANLQVEEFVRNDFASDAGHDWQALFEQEPDAGLGNGGLGRLAACFIDSLATLQIPAIGYGLRYEYGMFRQEIDDGRQVEHPDNWLIRPDPWEVVRPSQAVEVRLNCAFQMREGRLTVVSNVPTILRGIPYDRPVVGYGGRTINALRLWGASKTQSVSARGHRYMPWIWWSLVVLTVTGVALIVGNPRSLRDPALPAKLWMMVPAIATTLVLAFAMRGEGRWEKNPRARGMMSLAAVATLVLWLGVAVQGGGALAAAWARQAGRAPAGPAVIMLHVIALGWLMLAVAGGQGHHEQRGEVSCPMSSSKPWPRPSASG